MGAPRGWSFQSQPCGCAAPAGSSNREAFQAAVELAKLEAMKELAYGASHEVNNPLANIAARAQTLLRREADDDKRRMLEAIHRQAMRAHEMISDLMLFARPPRLDKEPVDMVASIQRVLEELRPLASQRDTQLVGPTPEAPLTALADRVQWEVALKALVTNSLEAVGSGGEVAASVHQMDGSWIEIAIHDTGPGISPEVREHLFDPFYSGREAGRGLGFGLSKCWRIVTDHGGRIDVQSSPGQGAVFTIRLPIAEVV